MVTRPYIIYLIKSKHRQYIKDIVYFGSLTFLKYLFVYQGYKRRTPGYVR